MVVVKVWEEVGSQSAEAFVRFMRLSGHLRRPPPCALPDPIGPRRMPATREGRRWDGGRVCARKSDPECGGATSSGDGIHGAQ